MRFLILLSVLVASAAGVPSKTANPTQDGRIEGGNPTEIENHPHQVALLFNWWYFCGGSIISPTCVVTAAHCVVGLNSDNLTVRAGSTFHEFGGTVHQVTGGFYHGSYNPFTLDYDVAVLRVFPPFNFSNSVRSIELLDSEVYNGTKVVVTGWGSLWPGGWHSWNLNEGFVQITDCDVHNGSVTDRTVCTVPLSGFTGPCRGDGGGPLTTFYCPYKLAGIVSWEVDCGNPFFPAVYTKVSAVRNWIISLCDSGIIPKGITKADAIP